MNQLTIDELRKVQMDILNDVHAFCKTNGITYSLAGGSMLGAVRHKGYIPWDDDIDICMYRTDYDRFIQLFPDNYKGRLKLLSLERDPYWHQNYAKVYDDRTITSLDTRDVTPYGVDIDVVPLDEVPDDFDEWKKYMRGLKFRYFIRSNKARKLSSKRSALNNIGIFLLSILLFPFSRHQLMLWANRYVKKNNGKGYNSVFESGYGPGLKNPIPKSLINETVEWVFEDRKYMGFKDADQYLRLSFGNYMELPPVEQRTQHSEKAYWKE